LVGAANSPLMGAGKEKYASDDERIRGSEKMESIETT